MPTLKNQTVRNAILLGSLCSVSYLAVYIARNILSAVTPAMESDGSFTKTQIGDLSSVFFITYAIGQLINGLIGDRVKAKYMISLGLVFSGICHIAFPLFSSRWSLTYASYALTGLSLSMIYAPMTKVVAENTTPIYAVRCSLGYTFASLIGSPLAGVLAFLLTWKNVFYAGSIILTAMGVVCFLAFSLLERKKIVQYRPFEPPKTKGGGIGLLIRRQLIRFTLVSILTGIVRTTVVFWLPDYFAEHLDFSPETSALLFSVATLGVSMATFIGIFVYELLRRKTTLVLLLYFAVSAGSFIVCAFIRQPAVNIAFIVLAVLSANCAAVILWSVYCPSLADTGLVSSATGFLDFASYLAAAISSTLFAHAVSAIGWTNLILVWFALMACGVVVALPFGSKSRPSAPEEKEETV